MKQYISKGFQDKIEVSLANISRNKNDKFSIVSMSYIPSTFKCDLCGHDPCLYAFTVKNLETSETIRVGSECVNHFKGECDIDVAEGLKKKIKSATRKMKRFAKLALGREEFKSIDKEQKREMVVKMYMAYQTKEILKDPSTKRVKLEKQDVFSILKEMDLNDLVF